MREDIERVLLGERAIAERLDAMAARITEEYRGRDLTVVALLNGSIIFMADLLRRIPLPLRLDCLRVSSYHGGTVSSGRVTFHQLTMPEVRGRHVLLLDDILDSGLTLAAVRRRLMEEGPASICACVLLKKRKPRLAEVDAEYYGFEIGDEFVVGYGLDYDEHYRNLPFVGVLRREAGAGDAAKTAPVSAGL